MPTRFLHGDVQATNLMVGSDSRAYRAIIDWGSACLGDMAMDFGAVPLEAVPYMLQGHREIARLDDDETAEARITWRHLQLVVHVLPRGAVPGLSWAERPVAMLLNLMHFFTEPPNGRWRECGPPERLPG